MKIRTWAVPASLALLLSACVVSAQPDDDGDYRRPPHRHQRHDEQRRQGDASDRRDDRGDEHSRGRHRYDDGRRNRQGAERFSCENGLSVTVRAEGNDRLSLRLDDKQALLTRAVSGSGARYTAERGLFGSGAEWHQKGSEAMFSFKDPYGNQVETSCQRR